MRDNHVAAHAWSNLAAGHGLTEAASLALLKTVEKRRRANGLSIELFRPHITR